MLFGRDSFRKKNAGRYLIGYQLFRDNTQISLLKIGEEAPFTFSLVKGQSEYQIPLCLLYLQQKKQWLIGKEAKERKKEFQEGYVEDLLEAAYRKEEVRLRNEVYDACTLLTLYLKKSFSLLEDIVDPKQAAAVMFVIDRPDGEKLEVLKEVTQQLSLGDIPTMFMGKEESFFWYNLHTEKSLWKGEVRLYEWEKEGLCSCRLHLDRNTTPQVTIVERREYSQWKEYAGYPSEKKDQLFLKQCREEFQDSQVTAVYLIGEGFQEDWYQESLKFLCRNRRVFKGNNLYSKGACQGLLQKMEPDKLGKSCVYLGEDKLLYHVGMELLRQGEEACLAILHGGNSWYECRKEWEIILEGSSQLVFRILPLHGKTVREHRMMLTGLEEREGIPHRIHLEARMLSANLLLIQAKDRGFGRFCPSSEGSWEERIEL